MPQFVAEPPALDISGVLQFFDGGADAVHPVLADAGKPLGGVVPALRQREHQGQQPLGFEGEGCIPQMVICHHGVVFGFVDTKYCHSVILQLVLSVQRSIPIEILGLLRAHR